MDKRKKFLHLVGCSVPKTFCRNVVVLKVNVCDLGENVNISKFLLNSIRLGYT